MLIQLQFNEKKKRNVCTLTSDLRNEKDMKVMRPQAIPEELARAPLGPRTAAEGVENGGVQ